MCYVSEAQDLFTTSDEIKLHAYQPIKLLFIRHLIMDWMTKMTLFCFCISYCVLVNRPLGRRVRSHASSLQIGSDCQWKLTAAVSPPGPQAATLSPPAALREKPWKDKGTDSLRNIESSHKCNSLFTLGSNYWSSIKQNISLFCV